MPRKAKIDAPGVLHHVIVRGIERGKMFRSDYEQKNFLNRLGKLISVLPYNLFVLPIIRPRFSV
jgi:putative transposase